MNLSSITFNWNRSSDIELSKSFDDDLDENTISRFNQNLDSYLKLTVGNDDYSLAKYD